MARCERRNEWTCTSTGKIVPKCDFHKWENIAKEREFAETHYQRIDMIPCGQCMECRLNRSREWANRLTLEKQMYPEEECWFVTLTYSDEYLPTHTTCNMETGEKIEGISLKVRDTQLFLKKLRDYYKNHYQNVGIRYFLAGEYGSQTHRPHYHIIFFGLKLDQSKLKFYKHNELGQSIWTHAELEKIWGKGFVTVGRVTWESAAYVARYCTKKMYGKEAWYYGAQGCIPEFTTCSRSPAIGIQYLKENMEKIYITDTIPICNKKTSQEVRPPKAFDKYMEKLNPEFMEGLKAERKRRAELLELAAESRSDLPMPERRKNKEEALKIKVKSLKREL